MIPMHRPDAYGRDITRDAPRARLTRPRRVWEGEGRRRLARELAISIKAGDLEAADLARYVADHIADRFFLEECGL
jgi:hypothetical protein